MIYLPAEIVQHLSDLGLKKYKTPLSKLILLGILAGIYISMAGLLSTMAAAGLNGWSEDNPILPKLVSGITFPIGLMLVVLVGAELFTGNTLYLMPATLQGRIPRTYFVHNWFVVYIANFIGALLFGYFLVYQAGVMKSPFYTDYLTHLAEYKVSLSWWQVFLRGIGANWLVCLAVWLGFTSQSMTGRLIGMWWPIMTFVVLGFEHSVANMFYIPTAIMHGAEVGWSEMVLHNLIPSTLGNIIGGAVCVGMCYYYLYPSKASDI